MTDNITLPREVAQFVLQVLEKGVTFKPGWVPECEGAITALRTHLAAPKQEPTPDDDDEEFTHEDVSTLLLEVMDWTYAKAHRNRLMTEAEQKVLADIRQALAAPSEDVEALRRDAERYRWLRDTAPEGIGDMASVRDSFDTSEIDAAIDAAMKGDKT